MASAGHAVGQNTQSWDWARRIGGTPATQTQSFGVVADANGNSYVTGSFQGTAQFGSFTLTSPAQTNQPYVAKLNASGTYQWVTTVSSWGRGAGQALALDAAGNVYVTGNFDGPLTFGPTTLQASNSSNDVFVAKLSPGGAWLWAAGGGGYSLDVGRAIAVNASGLVFVAGQIRDQATFGNTPAVQATLGFADIFVAALDAATGTWQWSRCAAGNPATTAANSYGWSLGLDAAGALYLTGSFTGPASFGSTTLTATGTSNDIFVAKLSAAGAWLWARQAGGNGTDECRALAVDGAGNVYLTGWYSGPATFGSTTLTGSARGYVAKLDAAGNWLWANPMASTSGNSVFSKGIALDATGQKVFIMGNFSGTLGLGTLSRTAVGPFDQYVAGLDAAGNWQWMQQASSSNRLVMNALAADPAGVLYTVGYALGDATFGQSTLLHPNPPAEQPYVARLATNVVTAVAAATPSRVATWPCPVEPTQPVHVRWNVGQHPTALVLRDALGREVYRQHLQHLGSEEMTFPAPSIPGWYQCQLLLPEAQPAVSRVLVQP
ncbi:hypothetical protein GCM10027044_04620 [Hymenobacter ruber]